MNNSFFFFLPMQLEMIIVFTFEFEFIRKNGNIRAFLLHGKWAGRWAELFNVIIRLQIRERNSFFLSPYISCWMPIIRLTKNRCPPPETETNIFQTWYMHWVFRGFFPGTFLVRMVFSMAEWTENEDPISYSFKLWWRSNKNLFSMEFSSSSSVSSSVSSSFSGCNKKQAKIQWK